MLQNHPTIRLIAGNSPKTVEIVLPSSKSIANRALIINALAGGSGNLQRLSEARDTQTMIRLLENDVPEWDVLDAGTTMRFLTAYGTVTGKHKILTGTARMKERPIGILVNALRELGAEIRYLENEGYPPIELLGISEQKTTELSIRGDVSSQYISALMMIAPELPGGLTLNLTGKIGSRPYIDMTRAVMDAFGVKTEWVTDHSISIPHQSYKPAPYSVEPDWSAASYWYSICAISGMEVFLEGLVDNSIQGDRKMADIMSDLGVQTEFTSTGTRLIPKGAARDIKIDFSDCPDIAQTVAVVGAVKGVGITMTGLESLRIKETDRIAALQEELAKVGISFTEPEPNKKWELHPGSISAPTKPFQTYHDHRMAMAFAPLTWLFPVEIENPDVVNKSYPSFWEHLKSAGAAITEVS